MNITCVHLVIHRTFVRLTSIFISNLSYWGTFMSIQVGWVFGTFILFSFLNDFCSITTLPPTLGSLNSLRELHISNNKLSGLPDEIGHLTQLQVLKANNNRYQLKFCSCLSIWYLLTNSCNCRFGQICKVGRCLTCLFGPI